MTDSVALRRPTGEPPSDRAVARQSSRLPCTPGLTLRAGLATTAGEGGANLADLMRQTRHKSTQVALAYLRPADL